jgi:hypothetical protein
VVLRSKTPTGAVQEAYGLLLTHYAIRSVMDEPALQADLDPDRLSFLRSIRATCRNARQKAGFSPETQSEAHQRVLDEILDRIDSARLNRANPRVIKRKVSNWPVKRPHHHNPKEPAPTDFHIIYNH